DQVFTVLRTVAVVRAPLTRLSTTLLTHSVAGTQIRHRSYYVVSRVFEDVLTHRGMDSLAVVHHRTRIHPLERPAAPQLPAKCDDRLPSFLLNEYIGTVHIECFSHVAIIIDMVGQIGRA